MKSLFKKLSFTCAALCFAIVVNAQNGDYVLLENGDTLKVEVKNQIFGKPVYVNTKGASVKIDPKEVKEYYVNDSKELKRAVSINVGKKKQFLKVEEDGMLTLYERIVDVYTNYGSTTQITWFISKNNGPLEQLKFNSWIAFNKEKRKEILGDMLADNKQAYDKYIGMDKKFTFKQIKNIVHLYNTGVWLGE